MRVRRLGLVSSLLVVFAGGAVTAGGIDALPRPRVQKAKSSPYVSLEKGVRVWRMPTASLAYGGASGYAGGGEAYDEPRAARYGNAQYGTYGGYFGYIPGAARQRRGVRTAAVGVYGGSGGRAIAHDRRASFAPIGVPGRHGQQGAIKTIEHGVRVHRNYGAPVNIVRGGGSGYGAGGTAIAAPSAVHVGGGGYSANFGGGGRGATYGWGMRPAGDHTAAGRGGSAAPAHAGGRGIAIGAHFGGGRGMAPGGGGGRR